jgi:hypothetical protein
MRSWLIPLLCVAFGCAVMIATTANSTSADRSGQVLRHVVLYKFKADLAPEKIQEVVSAFAALPKQIDSIVGFEHGTNVSEEGKSEGLTHCFVVTFRNEQGRDVYLKHAAHQAYVKLVQDRREKVIVFDYWADQ